MCVPLIAPLLAGASTAGVGAGAALAAGQAGALAATTTAATSAISLKTALSFAGQAFSAVNALQQQQAAKTKPIDKRNSFKKSFKSRTYGRLTYSTSW